MRIRNDHGREFEKARFEEFCHSHGLVCDSILLDKITSM